MKTDNFLIPNSVLQAMDMLFAHGFTAFIVGGCVRDLLMERTPNDWDITTSALPQQTKKVFENFTTIDTGIAHGTVTVIINGISLEITTFRCDGEYLDHRHPTAVNFSKTIEADLSRRDFTVNSIAYNKTNGYIDIFGGYNDIKLGIIRCVGEPKLRFNEDALRILRGIRFASTLNFTIENKTANEIHKQKESLKYVAKERICTEFKKLLLGTSPSRVINEYSDVIFNIIPQLKVIYDCPQNSPYHQFDVWHHTLKAIESTEPVLPVRLAVLFHDIGKGYCRTVDEHGNDHFYGHSKISANIAGEIMTDLRFDTVTKEQVCWLILHHDEPPLTKIRIKRILSRNSEEWLNNLLRVMYADIMAQKESIAKERIGFFSDAAKMLDEVKSECFSLKQLNIGGNDLIRLGYRKDKTLGDTLNKLLNLVIEGKIPNEPRFLESIAKDMLLTMYSQDQS